MKYTMGHFGQALDESLIDSRLENRQPAMIEDEFDYYAEDPEMEYYSDEEMSEIFGDDEQLEMEAQTATVKKTDAATAAMSDAPEKKAPNKKLIFGALAGLAALWYFNKE